MWEVFKFLLLCLISIIIGLTASFIYVCALFIVLVLVFYDFDFAVGLERHAINKFCNLYLKVRKLYLKTTHVEHNTDSFLYTPTMNSINKQTSTFELSRFNKSGNALSPITNSASNTTLSSRRLVQARQTSTPLTKTPPWQQSATNSIRSPHINSSLMNRSPRYSLSSVNASPKSELDGSPKPTIQTVTGPLLASTRFNVNLGTYMDTKSPGLASRIVQYNNELSGEQSSTHQVKYGSPGQFPIVQLYKKELPILARTPRRCTVRIAPPDPVSYSSDHASTILRDSFMQKNVDNISKQDKCDTEINTKSVLEALKEISRKRIHTNDDLEDLSKRQRTNSIQSPNNADHLNKDGKRMREDTPPKPKDASNTTPINSAPKRICVVNEIESSLSSSRHMRLQQGQKRKSTLDLAENNKQRRISNGELVSKETQTTITNGPKSNTLSTSTNTRKISTAAQTETEKPEQQVNNVQCILESARRKKKSDRRTIDDIDEENSTLHFSEVNRTTTKPFFSEAPLEILKQNKLAVMLSALSGQKPKIIPLPVMTLSAMKKRAEEDKTDGGGESKEVVSILSPKNKVKHDKHVTFSIPNSESDSNSKSDESTSAAASSTSSTNDATNMSFNPLSSQIIASNPVQFPAPPTASSNSISVPKSNFNFSSAITATSMPSPSNHISFGPITTTTVSTNIITSSIENKGIESQNKTSAVSSFNSNFEPLKTNFGGLAPSSNIEKTESTKTPATFSISTTNSLPKLATTSSSASTMFGIGTASSLTFPASSVNNITQANVVFSSNNPPAFSMPTTTASAANTIGSALNQQPFMLPTSNTTSAGNFMDFGVDKATSGLNTASSASTTAPPKMGGFKFDLGKSPSTSVNSVIETSKPPAFNSGSAQNTFTFGATTTASIANPVALPTTSAVTFGTPVTTTSTGAPIFGASTTNAFGTSNTLANTPGFSTPSSTAKNLFGIPTTAKTAVFNTNTTTASSGMFGNTISTGVFGNANTSTNSTPATTTATPSNVFGTPATNTATGIFGSSAAPPAFGSTKTDNPPPPAFGGFGATNTPQNTSGFRAFSAPTTTQNTTNFTAFGSTATTQANTFGNAPTTTQNTTFGNLPTTTQNNNTFGSIATTTQSATFGAPAPAATNKAFTFGASTAPKEFSFGSSTAATTTASNVFGSTTSTPAASSLFGGNANSAFRAVTTTPPNAFGTATTTTAPSTFGQSSSGGVFGTANNSSFNNNAASTVFGGNNNNSTFGSAAPSVFGSTNQPASNFAPGTSNVFGGTSNTNQTGNTMFGTTTNNTTFGTSGFSNNNNNTNNNNAAQAASFGSFGSPAAQPSAPQSSGVFAFGSPAQPAAAAPPSSNAFQFGAATQAPKPAGFNFSGSSAPNLNFGSGAPPSFSASPAPAFGSPAPSGFNANTPATGMFNIGSGSTAPKQRPMIKARRRN